MNKNQQKVKDIVTEAVLGFLNEARFDFPPQNIKVKHLQSQGFDVPIKPKKGPVKKDKTSILPPDIMKFAKEIPRHPYETNEEKLRDTQNTPTNTEDAEDPIDTRGRFDGLDGK